MLFTRVMKRLTAAPPLVGTAGSAPSGWAAGATVSATRGHAHHLVQVTGGPAGRGAFCWWRAWGGPAAAGARVGSARRTRHARGEPDHPERMRPVRGEHPRLGGLAPGILRPLECCHGHTCSAAL